jgi:hypothetical protein
MRIVEYADAYSYACGITPHKHKKTAYTAMRPHFKTMDLRVRRIIIVICQCILRHLCKIHKVNL